MGIKQFNADVKAAIEAASSNFPGVSDMRKGDSDGEIVFSYICATEDGAELPPINIQALSTEPEAYPRHPGFLIFTSSEKPAGLEKWLQEISELTKGKSVTDVIALISQTLAEKLESPDQPHSKFDGDSSDDGFAFDDSEESCYEGDFDEMDIDPLPSKRPPSYNEMTSDFTSSIGRLKRHLREVRSEGIHVSIPTEERTSFRIFSLAVHASKLNIPEEALEAWGLKPSEYVVMLFKLPSGYPTLSAFLRLPSDQTTVQFKFGKCVTPDPAYGSATRAFERVDSEGPEEGPQSKDGSASPFLPLYMSLSLDTLLNKEFPRLLQLRRSEGISWDQAQKQQFELSRGNHNPAHVLQSTNTNAGEMQDSDSDSFELELLQRNYMLKDAEDLNVILIAMQFGLQRLVKCTNYCLVCHQRVGGSFEAVKPFVCDNSLCLFQYLSLGFCQSIEHEIINNPNVVDLLISFFYAAVTGNRLREFPKGLGLECAISGFKPSDIEPLSADVCFQNNSIRFGSFDYAQYKSIKEGKYITILLATPNFTPKVPIMQGYHEKYICVIDSCRSTDFTFKIIKTHTGFNVKPDPDSRPSQATHPKPVWVKALVYKHEQDIDELEMMERDQALTIMSECIPPVQDMRRYLTERPGRQLSSWKRMDKSTTSLLNWIVASNRSSIVQDAPIPGFTQPQGEMYKNDNLVSGMNEGWVQFRFVQGSPEKEQMFRRELMQTTSSRKPYPSLFAWHGSALGNWHSIIRTGLDFSQTLNGRAYGDGVYFARDFTVSCGYSARGGGCFWPNSDLKITNAISVCEIVNDTARFVSTQPYFVVNRVDWIQCRYLFIQVHDTLIGNGLATVQSQPTRDGQPANAVPFTAQPTIYIEQDPAHLLTSESRPVGIPQSAIPISRRREPGQKQTDAADPSQQCLIVLDGPDAKAESSYLDDLLASDDEGETQSTIARKRRRTSVDSGLGETRSLATRNPWEPDNVTYFQPGQLDLDSLPKLAEPDWAASSPAALRALNSQIKDLQKIQSNTNIATLGWYIDFGKLENLFHWIVELHSFDMELPLAQDMVRHGCSSIVMEVRFGASFPISPPFVRVIRPRFVPFANGGGGHVTMGGSICSELLTNSGWSPALSLEKVFIEVRMNLCEKDPPARIEQSSRRLNAQSNGNMDYGMFEAVDAYRRAAAAHGWQIPSDLEMLNSMMANE